MKVIEKSPMPTTKQSVLGGTIDQVQRTLGLVKETERQAAEKLIMHLRVLPAPWTMLCDVQLPGLAAPLPLILIGPPGIYAILASPVKGVFRVKEDTWLEIKSGEKEFTTAQPNLVAQSQQFAREIEAFVAQKGYEIPEVQSVLFFSNPGVHVDPVRPAVRILLVDALERFVSNLSQSPAVYSSEDVHILVRIFDEPEPLPEEVPDLLSEEDSAEPAPEILLPPKESAFEKAVDKTMNRLSFTRSQWIAIGLAVLVNIIMLIMLIIAYILYY